MKAKKYPKVAAIPAGAMPISYYASTINQKNPAYICHMYDRFLAGTGKDPGFIIVNCFGTNFVVLNN